MSAIAEHDVLDKDPTAPSVCPPLCESDRFVDVAGLWKEALVVFGTGDGEPLWREAAPCDGTATFGVHFFFPRRAR